MLMILALSEIPKMPIILESINNVYAVLLKTNITAAHGNKWEGQVDYCFQCGTLWLTIDLLAGCNTYYTIDQEVQLTIE